MADTIETPEPTDDEIRQLVSNEPAAGGDPAPGAHGGPQPGANAGEGAADDHEHDDVEDDEDQRGRVDAEMAAAQDEAERAQIRERRRQERKDKRERAKQKQASLERQVEALTRQNQEMQQQLKGVLDQSAGAQMAQLDHNIAEAEHAVNHFKNLIAEATTKGDGATVAQATEYMVQARERAAQLKAIKTRVSQPQRTAADPMLVNHAKKFMSENSWYGGPRSNDPDSRVLTAVDNSLMAEGWDPTTEAYWAELRVRAKRYLGHRFNGAGAEGGGSSGKLPATDGQRGAAGKSRTPVAGASGDRSGGGGEGEGSYNLSAERVRAIKEAGAWDDPKRRQKMIDRYKEYDKQQAANR